MALGKARVSKRSSSSTSYTSTITTIVFITLCVLGVWMLTSNPIAPPQSTTTRTSTAASDNENYNERDKIVEEMPKTVEKKDPPVFEDNPGDLPDDAIKPDLPKNKQQQEAEAEADKVKEQQQQDSSVIENLQDKTKESDSSQISEESTLTQSQIETEKQQQQEEESQASSLESEQQQQQQQQENSSDNKQEESEQQQQQQQQDTNDNDNINNNSIKQEENAEQDTQQQQQEAGGDDGNANTQQESQNQPEIEQSEQQQQEPNRGRDNPLLVEEQKQQQLREDLGNEDQQQQKQQQQQQQEKKEENSNSNLGDSNGGGLLTNSATPKESTESKKTWKTQASQSANEKERRIDESNSKDSMYGYAWQLCNETAAADYIPCLDNLKAVKKLSSRRHYEHRERHCPEDPPTCLVPLPQGYKRSIKWPSNRDKIWYRNVPHTLLAEVKGHQNWVKVTGEFLTFPGGGTQFIHGALHYIDFVQGMVPEISWGKRTRVVLDVGCGVASFGGYLFEKDVLTMSFAPKDEHEAQVQFALERGIPAISAVMGSQRLSFPSAVFDIIHCARCRVPWHGDGGLLLLELNRLLRPGGFFVWSATPVYQKLQEDMEIWDAMSNLTKAMCWELVNIERDAINHIGAAIYRKPTTNDCYESRKHNSPPMCKDNDDPNAAWYVPLQACMHHVPVDPAVRGAQWPEEWPRRLHTPPYWMNNSQMGIYGKPSPQDFVTDSEYWKKVVNTLYMTEMGINWAEVRNVMDMRAVYGGFASALKEYPVWVVNVVNVNAPDTLPIIYERGLFGIYHDWCESFSTYPRTYDLLHADHLFSSLKNRCKLVPVLAEIDRIVRPGGQLIVRDESSTVGEVESLLKSLHWEVRLTISRNQYGILNAVKGKWRPDVYAVS